jgi:hypothetical protein
MCHVCKDEQCHYGEYCYPEGVTRRPQQEAADRAVEDMATSDADARLVKMKRKQPTPESGAI